MGFDEGRIILENENGYYVPGQTIIGRIVFDQGKPKDIHGIYISCKGFCKVHWTTRKTRRVNNRTETRTIHHESFEEYFKEKHFVIGSVDGECHIKEGQHEYKFSCPIPNNCPSSFEGNYGHIRYQVKAVMVTQGMFTSNKEKKVALQVRVPLDLNENPYCKAPIEFELNNTYCCWCVSAGFSEVRVKLPVGGYCPGQVIPLEVSVVNQSRVKIDELKFSIKENIKFKATTNPATKYDSNTVAKIKKGPIPANTTRNWQVDMEVPAMTTYNLDGCRYIDIEHMFKVTVETSRCHNDGDESHPIIIGNIPLVISPDMVHIPLQDQNVQAVNYYPPPAIVQQPYPSCPNNAPYPLTGSPYPPTGSPYPPNRSPYPPNGSPNSNIKHNEFHTPNVAPYPVFHMPEPSQSPAYDYSRSSSKPSQDYQTKAPLAPYPTSDSVPFECKSPVPYSSDPPPYPGIGSVSFYPPNDNVDPTTKSTAPYPKNDVFAPHPTSDAASPNPTSKSGPVQPLPTGGCVPPYPTSSIPPYPTVEVMPSHDSNPSVPPYHKNGSGNSGTSNITVGLLKTGTIGFGVPIFGDNAKAPSNPAVSPYATSPATNPYAVASAPEPSTPGSDNSIPSITISRSPAYNPEFVDVDKECDTKK